jgi:hypothetical protein
MEKPGEAIWLVFTSETDITTDMMVGLDQTIDIIVIFDCYYSSLAARNTNSESRIVEILSAGDKRDPVTFAAGKKNSLSSKAVA